VKNRDCSSLSLQRVLLQPGKGVHGMGTRSDHHHTSIVTLQGRYHPSPD
jgi:hypothetical protein